MAWRTFTIPAAEQIAFYGRIATLGLGPDEVGLFGLEATRPPPGPQPKRVITVTHSGRSFRVDATCDGDWIAKAAAIVEMSAR